MWLFLSAVIVCFTIIVLFRMYIDLRRVDHQHIRMLQSDVRNHERYAAVTGRPLPKAEFPDWERPTALTQGLAGFSYDQVDALERLAKKRKTIERTYGADLARYSDGKEPVIDPRMTEWMRHG